jgi:hypothetical protein
MRKHLTYANVVATLCLVLILGGGAAYAANTVFSTDIVNDQVYSADVRNDTLTGGGLAAADLRPGSVGRSEVSGLTGADIANAASGSDNVNADKLDGVNSSGLVQGSGRLLSNRMVFVPETAKTLLQIPGLGELQAVCLTDDADVRWRNTTTSTLDLWHQGGGGTTFVNLVPPGAEADVASNDFFPGGTFSVGLGNDPGPRRIATFHAFAFQSSDGAPCGFQTQGTLWTSP